MSATAGSDYEAVSGTLEFADGETSKEITVPLTDDALEEGNEMLRVTLDGVGDSRQLHQQGEAFVNIRDDDTPPDIEFETSSYEVDETRGYAEITVTRRGAIAGEASVHYSTVDGSATAGTDYEATSGTLSRIARRARRLLSPSTGMIICRRSTRVSFFLSIPPPEGCSVARVSRSSRSATMNRPPS
ncbi:MAG: hypothetical protein C4321_03860 [Chloroflexota bacterium]